MSEERAAPRLYVGPFDREPWPEKLTATVVSPGPRPRLAGYGVADDLARHYGLVEVAWLALRGELPSEAEREAFETALVLLCPVHLGEAPAHAAFLSRLLAAQPSATIAVAAVGLGELGRVERADLAPWLAWLADADADARPTAAPPACALAESAAGAVELEWLNACMARWFGPAAALPAAPLHPRACAYAILHHLGLREPLTLELLAAWARLPVVLAEALAARPGDVRSYPARLPDYRYLDDEGASP